MGRSRRRRASSSNRRLPTSSLRTHSRRPSRTNFLREGFSRRSASRSGYVTRRTRMRSRVTPRSRLFYNAPLMAPPVPLYSPVISLPESTPVVRKKVSRVRSVCDSRRVRSEVMFASGKAGKSGQKTPKWTSMSRKKC